MCLRVISDKYSEFITVFNFQGGLCDCKVKCMNELILKACKELIDDAKLGCADLVFKDICLDILSRASNILSDKQFSQLVDYAAEKMKAKVPLEVQPFSING